MLASMDPEIVLPWLRRRLTRRRLSQLDLRLRLELILLSLLLAGFVFWQVRIPLAGLRAQSGPVPVLAALSATFVVLAGVTTLAIAVRHARRLRRGHPGLPWLSLPISSRALAGHLAWESRLISAWVAVPSIGVWASGLGLVSLGWLSLLGAAAFGLLVLASRAGAWLGLALAALGIRSRAPLSPIERVLAEAPRSISRPKLPVSAWRRMPGWVALCWKDARITQRVGAVRRQLVIALLFWTLSVLAWRLPEPVGLGGLDYVAAFVLALLGSAALGEWLVGLSGSDPFAALRSLPIGLGTVWAARFAWAAAGMACLLAAHGLAAAELWFGAHRLFLAWIGAATLAIAALAVNYGVTLFPRADVAQRLLGLSLGLAVVASLMIPLLGWLVLAAAVVHSARRLPQWSRLEEV